jgi:hypothetical protein
LKQAGETAMPIIHDNGESECSPTTLGISSVEEARQFKGSHKIDPDEADQVAEAEETIPDLLRRMFTMWDV